MNIVRLWKKKPVEVQVMQWDGSLPAATDLIVWILNNGGTARYVHRGEPHFLRKTSEMEVDIYGETVVNSLAPAFVVIDSPKGAIRNDPEDYTILNAQGDFHSCCPDTFAQNYERS